MSDHKVLVDCAGAPMGGARRFRGELEAYLADEPGPDVHVVGRGRRLTPSWVTRRESPRRYHRAVALNNVSLVATRAERWVLLRKPLYYLTGAEKATYGRELSPTIHLEGMVARMAARRADVVVVPSQAMAERVLACTPDLAGRMVVRFHPITPTRSTEKRAPGVFLCPVLFAATKRMGPVLRAVDEAATMLNAGGGPPVRVLVTATADQVAAEGLSATRNLTFIGQLTPAALAVHTARARALIFPTRVESFGYPLAEARVNRQPVVALDTAQNREVAGDALVGYQDNTADELATAMLRANELVLPPLADSPFDRDRYFRWLFGRPQSAQAGRRQ
jgi:Glycosyl transferases group 1